MLFQDLPKSNPDLNTFIGNQESRPEVGAKLMSLLIAPIQRIPRYRLLLKEVVSHTPISHPDYPVLMGKLFLLLHILRLIFNTEKKKLFIFNSNYY